MEKELEAFKEGPKTKIHLDSLKKYQIGKRRALMAYMDTGLKNSLPSTTEWLYKKQIHRNGWSKERPPKRNRPQQLQAHNVPTDDVENRNGTNHGDLLFANKLRTVHQKTENCHEGKRGKEELLYIDQHILMDRKMRRKDVAMVWIDYKKAYDMVPQNWIIHCLKMFKISDEVKVYQEYHENWRVELAAGEKKLCGGKNPDMNLPRRCAITITICNCDDAPQSHI